MQGKTDNTYIRDACKEMRFVEGAPPVALGGSQGWSRSR
jgi:hypothetical protein